MNDIIIGKGGKGGSGGGGATEVDDTLRSVQYAKILDAVCEGEIEGWAQGIGQSVFFDETPWKSISTDNNTGNPIEVENFKSCKLYSNTGTQAQQPLSGFYSGVETEVDVSTEVSIAGGPIVRSFSSSIVDKIRVTIGIPRLTQTDTTNGSISGSSVQYKISVQGNGAGYQDQVLGSESSVANIISNTATTVAASSSIYGNVTIENPSTTLIVDAVVEVQYKSTSATTWSVISSTSVSLLQKYVSNEPGSLILNHLANQNKFSFTFLKENLSSDSYNIRTVVISGAVTANLDSCNSIIPSTTITISGKTTSRYQESYEIDLSSFTSPFDIKVTRISVDAPNQATQNQTFWDSYTKIESTKLSYPNTALVGVIIDASQFKSIPNRAYYLKLKKVSIPSNYNPVTRVYTGVWDGTFTTAWTDNPAWCFYDLVTNTRYGLGEYIPSSWVDKISLYTIGQYCDELVPSGFGDPATINGVSYSSFPEPRFTCNLYLQNQDEAFRVIQNMASIFRGMIYWLGGTIVPVADKPESVWAQFTNADVFEGSFSYQGSASRSRHTVALVTWNDPGDNFKPKVEYVEDTDGINRYGVNQTEVAAMGCTSQGQAHRLGKWLLYSERMETEIVTFKTSLKGTNIVPGKIINVFDQFRAGKRNGGRIVSSTSTSLTIDSAVTLPSGTNLVDMELPDGSIVTRTLSNTVGSTSILTWTTPLSTQPLNGTIWIVTNPSLFPETWRVLSVTEELDNTYTINAVSHNTSKFSAIEQNYKLVSRQSTVYNSLSTVKAPSYKAGYITDSIYKLSNNVIATRIHLSWIPSAGA